MEVALVDIFLRLFSFLIQKPHSQQRIGISGIIQVKHRIAGHSQNFSAVYIHDNTAHIVGPVPFMGLVLTFLVIFGKILLHNSLDIQINGGDNTVAVLCGYGSAL